MYLLAEEGEEQRWKTPEDLPGEKTYVDLLATERWKTAEDLPGEKT